MTSDRGRVAVIVGTRPEAIKMAPVMTALRSNPGLHAILVSTGQHSQMLTQTLAIFGLKPDVEIKVMRERQTLSALSARLLVGLDSAFAKKVPQFVLVQGDTTTTFAASLAAYYNHIPVGHVEAGLRTFDKRNPFPEEMNRRLTGHIADLHFAPTERARQNLLQEGICGTKVYMTGNTVVDALQDVSRRTDDSVLSDTVLEGWLDTSAKLVLVTAHRRESFGIGLQQICLAIKRFADLHGNTVQIVFPVHLNPQVHERVHSELSAIPNVRLIEPVDYHVMVALLRRCHFVLTDSGGIQEEAPTFGKPVLVMRDTTERPEGIEAGIAKLVGVSAEKIITEASRLLESEEAYLAMAQIHSPYGDGRAAERIVEAVTQYLEPGP